MRISPNYNPYASRIANEELQRRAVENEEALVRSKELEEVIQNDNKKSVANSDDLLSKRERNFFVNLFPESKNQIENHVLFTRNGRIKEAAINKGQLVDARV